MERQQTTNEGCKHTSIRFVEDVRRDHVSLLRGLRSVLHHCDCWRKPTFSEQVLYRETANGEPEVILKHKHADGERYGNDLPNNAHPSHGHGVLGAVFVTNYATHHSGDKAQDTKTKGVGGGKLHFHCRVNCLEIGGHEKEESVLTEILEHCCNVDVSRCLLFHDGCQALNELTEDRGLWLWWLISIFNLLHVLYSTWIEWQFSSFHSLRLFLLRLLFLLIVIIVLFLFTSLTHSSSLGFFDEE